MRKQTGDITSMVFEVAHLVSYLTAFRMPFPVSLISTGTPPGVGQGKWLSTFCRLGQEMWGRVAGLAQTAQPPTAAPG